MELVMHGLSAVLVVSALLAASVGGLMAPRAHLYNVQHDSARRR